MTADVLDDGVDSVIQAIDDLLAVFDTSHANDGVHVLNELVQRVRDASMKVRRRSTQKLAHCEDVASGQEDIPVELSWPAHLR